MDIITQIEPYIMSMPELANRVEELANMLGGTYQVSKGMGYRSNSVEKIISHLRQDKCLVFDTLLILSIHFDKPPVLFRKDNEIIGGYSLDENVYAYIRHTLSSERIQQNLSRTQVQKLTGVHVNNYEKGHYSSHTTTINRVAKLLRLGVEYLPDL